MKQVELYGRVRYAVQIEGSIEDVTAAVADAIARGAIGFDAVKHLVLCRIERRPPRLDMTIYPYLPRATVATTSARSYMTLLAGAGS